MGYSKRPGRPGRPANRPGKEASPKSRPRIKPGRRADAPATESRSRTGPGRRRDEAGTDPRSRGERGRPRDEAAAESPPRTQRGRRRDEAAPESRPRTGLGRRQDETASESRPRTGPGRREEGGSESRPRKPQAGTRSRAAQYQTATRKRGPKPKLEVRWLNLQSLVDVWGHRIPRYYGLHSLTRATEGVLHGNDRFILPSIQQVLGPAPLASLTFELFQEGQFQLIFLVRAVNARRNMGTFAYVVAKRPGDFSKVAALEHENLRMLNERDPDHIVRPYRGGRILLYDRRLGEGPKEVYAYLTQWLGSYHELGVAKNLQLYVNIKTPKLFSALQTEDIKGQIVEVIVRSYDPDKRTCMEMPQVASGDFVVTEPSKARPHIKLIACRRLLHNVTPAKIIHRILEAHWDWGGRDFRLAPERPETFTAAFERALGQEAAKPWIEEYQAQLARASKS